MWGDEAASVMSAERPWDSLWAMAANVDAVHALYYAFLHVWIDLFGASAFSVRLPSALAIGVTVAGVYTLCRSFAGARVAIVASIACTLLPRVDYMAAEARSAAFTAAFATWLTVLLVHLVRHPGLRARWWVLYGGLLVVSVHLFLYSALMVVVHLLCLLVLRAPRAVRRRWLISTLSAGAACLPFAIIASRQRGQIAFLAHRDVTTPDAVLVTQWFGSLPIAIAAWTAVLLAIAWVIWQRRSHPFDAEAAGPRALTLISLAWLLVPTVLLLFANAAAGPLYTARYLSFSAPAAGILIAVVICLVLPRPAAIVAGCLVVVLAVPVAVSQRTDNAKFGSDWAQVSAYVGEHGKPGDGVVFDESVRASRKPRLALRLYPDGFRDTADLGLVRSYETTDHLWDVVERLGERPHVLDGRTRVWVVARSTDGTSADEQTLLSAGFHPTTTFRLSRDVIKLYTKDAS